MKRKRLRPRLSLGTIIMLLFTFLVILGCSWFMLRITGEDMASRAAQLVASLTFAEDTPEPVQMRMEQETPVPAVTSKHAPRVSAATTASPTPIPEKRTITLAAAGSVYAPPSVSQTVEEMGAANFTPVFEGIREVLAPADLAIVTLEGLTAGSELGYDNYNVPVQLLDALRACGVDMVSLGTERALDKGYEGLSITMQELASRGLSSAGVSYEGGPRESIVRIGGVEVALLAYSYGLSEEGEARTDDDSRGMLARLDIKRIQSDIAGARNLGADVVVVLPHWGTKNKLETPEVIRVMAKELARAGADVILGTHPNVPQGVERMSVTRADGLAYETIVCYSLGSLLTDARTPENTAGMAAMIDITYDPVTRRAELGDIQVTPLYIAKTRIEDKTAYRVVPAGDEAALAALDAAEREAAKQAAAIVYEATGEASQP